MKQKTTLLLTLLLFLTGCSPSVEQMEILSSYNEDCISYSLVEKDGSATTLLFSETGDQFRAFQAKLKPELFDSIVSQTKNATEDDFKFTVPKNKRVLYCGPHFRFRIKFNNGLELYLRYHDHLLNSENLEFKIFDRLYNTLASDTLQKANLSQQNRADDQRRIFEKYVWKRDLLTRLCWIIESHANQLTIRDL